jgi:hypothetical protein
MRSKILLILGIFLLAIGLVATFYYEMQYPFTDVLDPMVSPSRVYPYQSIGILLDAAGVTSMALGLLAHNYQESKAHAY